MIYDITIFYNRSNFQTQPSISAGMCGAVKSTGYFNHPWLLQLSAATSIVTTITSINLGSSIIHGYFNHFTKALIMIVIVGMRGII